jgi:hypothetical protein
MMVMIFDKDVGDNDDLLGRCWITFDTVVKEYQGIKYYYKSPKWYNIYHDATE